MKRFVPGVQIDYIVVSGATVFCSLLTFLYNIVVRNFVPPEDYGIYVTVDLLIMYFNYLQLGVLNSYNRDYPQLLGGNNELEAKYTSNVVWSYLLIVYALAGLLAIIIFITIINTFKFLCL